MTPRTWCLSAAEDVTIVLQQLAHEQEGIDSRDAVGHHIGYKLPLRDILTLHEHLSPQRREARAVLLQLFCELLLALTDFLQRVVSRRCGFLYR